MTRSQPLAGSAREASMKCSSARWMTDAVVRSVKRPAACKPAYFGPAWIHTTHTCPWTTAKPYEPPSAVVDPEISWLLRAPAMYTIFEKRLLRRLNAPVQKTGTKRVCRLPYPTRVVWLELRFTLSASRVDDHSAQAVRQEKGEAGKRCGRVLNELSG